MRRRRLSAARCVRERTFHSSAYFSPPDVAEERVDVVTPFQSVVEHEGVLEAIVISALPIGDEQVKPLLASLESKFKRRITARVEIDPQLIGGVKIVVGDKVIDASVRGRLDAMAATLTH